MEHMTGEPKGVEGIQEMVLLSSSISENRYGDSFARILIRENHHRSKLPFRRKNIFAIPVINFAPGAQGNCWKHEHHFKRPLPRFKKAVEIAKTMEPCQGCPFINWSRTESLWRYLVGTPAALSCPASPFTSLHPRRKQSLSSEGDGKEQGKQKKKKGQKGANNKVRDAGRAQESLGRLF